MGGQEKPKKESTLRDRMDDQAKGIVPQIDPETDAYMEALAKKLGIRVKSSAGIEPQLAEENPKE